MMIALNAEELSVPLSMLSSIRDIALRFLFEYIHKWMSDLGRMHDHC